jgi:hypothetical protein
MPHGDAVGHGDRGELARRAVGLLDAQLHRLRLTVQRDVAGRGLVPAGRDADEGLVDLLLGQPHRVEIRPVRRARRPLGHVAAGQLGLVVLWSGLDGAQRLDGGAFRGAIADRHAAPSGNLRRNGARPRWRRSRLHRAARRSAFSARSRPWSDISAWRSLICVAVYAVMALIPVPGATLLAETEDTLWASFLPLALVGVLVQTGAEEVLFRGYLQQQLAARFASPLAWMVLPSVIFALLHYQPELMGENAWLMVAHELDHQLRPAADQLDLLAPRDAGEPVVQMRRMRHDAVPPRIQGQPERLHQLRPPHGDHAARSASPRCSTAASSPRSRCRCRWPTRCISATRRNTPTGCAPRRKATGEAEAMLVAEGEIGRTPIVAAAQDFSLHGRVDGHVCRQRHHRRRRSARWS